MYEIGDLVRVSASFFNSTSGSAVDPTAVYFKYQINSYSASYAYGTDVALVKSSSGIYYVDVNAASSGDYHCLFWSTGTGQGAARIYFQVRSGSVV